MNDEFDGPRLRGQLFVARLEYLRRYHGAESVAKVLGSLSESDQELLKGLDGSAWYPFGALVRFDKAAAKAVVPGDTGIFERFGAASSRIRNEWLGEHAALVSPHAFLSRVADEHRRYHTFGRVIYRRTGFTEGEIVCSEYPEVDETFCLGARGYLRGTVELLTSGPVSIEERHCQGRGDPACIFWLRWTGAQEARGDPGSR